MAWKTNMFGYESMFENSEKYIHIASVNKTH